jgi:DUF4097 and DUF4098 domain-containing protein YvlB
MPASGVSRLNMVVLLFAAAAFLAAPPPANAEEWTKTFEVAGRPSVRINTNDGAVRVLTAGGYKQVAVRVEHNGYQPDRDFTIDARQTGNRVEVEARLQQRWCIFCINSGRSFKIEVRMPADADLQVDTGDGSVEVEPVNGGVNIHTGDGRIRLDGAKGSIRLRTGDGSIETYRLDGQLDASSGDGHIRAEGRFDRLNITTGDGGVEVRALPGSKVSSAWTIHTGDGSVALSLPDNLQANINAQTNDGHVSLGIPLQVEGNLRRNLIRGKLNGGGESLSISTGDGSIRLNRS